MATEVEIERKLQELFDSTILGGYNFEARKQAMEAKFQEQVKLYHNKAKIDERKRIGEIRIYQLIPLCSGCAGRAQ